MSKATQWEVLLVEDSTADTYLVQQAIADSKKNIRLWFIANGQDALGFLRKEGSYVHAPSPALILLDLNLPKLDGHQVLTELRRLPAYQATPVVIFSAARKDLEEQHCLQLGANAYVQKPVDFDSFFAAVPAIVQHWLKPAQAS